MGKAGDWKQKEGVISSLFLTCWKADMEVMRWRDEVGDVRGGDAAKTKTGQCCQGYNFWRIFVFLTLPNIIY